MHDQQLQCVSVFREVNAWKPQVLPNAPKMFLSLAWFPKETGGMQPHCSFVCLSGSPFVGNVKQSRQKCKDLRGIAIPARKHKIKEQGREEADHIVPVKPMHTCQAVTAPNTSAVWPKHPSSSIKGF